VELGGRRNWQFWLNKKLNLLFQTANVTSLSFYLRKFSSVLRKCCIRSGNKPVDDEWSSFASVFGRIMNHVALAVSLYDFGIAFQKFLINRIADDAIIKCCVVSGICRNFFQAETSIVKNFENFVEYQL
jgi:hypothetical protein